MSKSMLLKAGLFSLVCLPVVCLATAAPASQANTPTNQSPPTNTTQAQGAVAPGANQPTTPTTTTVTPTALTPSTPLNPTAATAAAAAAAVETKAEAPTQGTSGTPVASPTNDATPPQSSTSQTSVPAPLAPATTTLDCNYHIPPTTSAVDTALVMQWGQKAAQQTFTFDPSMLDSQLTVLKACYTEQGWQSFNDALQKSGNLDAIKKENLTVSSVIDGQTTITSTKNNEWKVIVPIQVVYQNGKEKIAQLLSINLTISRKVSGDLGVMQIVAMPRPTNTTPAAVPATPTNSGATTTPSDTSPSTPAAATVPTTKTTP